MTCPWCGGEADPASVCPKSITCPDCDAAAGARCRRPSGHEASELHAARVQFAAGMSPVRDDLVDAMRAIAAAERDAWTAYMDPTSHTQEHQLYVPGCILEWGATLEALDHGIRLDAPETYPRLEVTYYWRTTEGNCRRALSVDVHGSKWHETIGNLTMDDYERQQLVAIRWRPHGFAEEHMWPVPKLGALDHENAGSPRSRLWMPFVPLARGAELAQPEQLSLI